MRITSCTLAEGKENESLSESTNIPKYSMTLVGMITDLSQLIKNPKASNKFCVNFRSVRYPSSDSFIFKNWSRYITSLIPCFLKKATTTLISFMKILGAGAKPNAMH